MPFQPYPVPHMTSITDVLGYANYYTNGSFVLFTLLAVWVISFAFFKKYETKVAITGSTTLTFLLALPLSMIKFQGYPLVAPQIVISLLVLSGISAVWLRKSGIKLS